MTIAHQQLDAWIDAHFDEEVKFLQELIRVPTDTPPGNNAPHAERTAELLAGMGLPAEKHAVPEAEVKAAGLAVASGWCVGFRVTGVSENLKVGALADTQHTDVLDLGLARHAQTPLHEGVIDINQPG